MRRLLITAVLGCLLLPAAAWGSADALIKDCTDGVIQGHYSQEDYKNALAHLPTDVDEYTDCRDVLKRAQLGLTGGGSGGGASGGGTGGGTPANGDPLANATPAERAAVAAAQAGAAKPVNIGGKLVQPGKLGFGGLGSPTTLPGSLIAVLVALGIAAVAAGATYVRNRVIARRSA